MDALEPTGRRWEVERVLRSAKDSRGRSFALVKWVGLSEQHNFWISARDLDLVEEEVLTREMRNFRPATDSLALVRSQMQAGAYRLPDGDAVVVENYFGQLVHLAGPPALLDITYKNHAFILASYKERLYLLDGANSSLHAKALRRQIYHDQKRRRGCSPKPIRVVGQPGVDHCASSAAMICLELLKLFRCGADMPEEVCLPWARRARLVRAWHPYKSERLRGPGRISGAEVTARLRCPGCSKVFRPQSSLNRHLPKCPALRDR